MSESYLDAVLARHVHWGMDLHHAIRCADQILERKLHNSNDSSDLDLLKCLSTALIVSYCRPFTNSNAPPGVPKAIPESFRSDLTKAEEQLHDEVCQQRNRDRAHSDAEGRETTLRRIEGPRGSIILLPISRDPDAPLNRETVDRVRALAGKILVRVGEAQRALTKRVLADGLQ